MSNPYIVEPAAAGAERRIDLAWTDAGGTVREIWLKLKTELSIGEHRRMLKSISKLSQEVPRTRGTAAAPAAQFEWTDYGFARMEAYIIDWSLAHDPDQSMRLPPTRVSYEALRQGLYNLIDEALSEHEQRQGDEKKAPAGTIRPEAISA